MKKWLVPFAFPFISIVAFLFIGVVGILGNGDGTGYGGVVIVLVGIIIYCVIAIPAMCLLYSKCCLLGQRFRLLFTFYQSFFITLPYCIFFSKENETIVYSILLYSWCELWALLGLLKFKSKNAKQDIE